MLKFSLQAVLTVRQQKEQAEERALAALSARMQPVRATLARVSEELTRHASMRRCENDTLRLAAEHQAAAARWRALREAEAELHKQLLALEQQRLEQQTRYLTARRDREMLTDLQQQQMVAWAAADAAQERKQTDDLFLSRRLRS